MKGNQSAGIDLKRLIEYALQIKEVAQMGVRLGIVFGGGNIFRGLHGANKGFDRVKGDYIGMLATVINGLAIQSALESINVRTHLFTAIRMEPIGEGYSKPRMMEAFENGKIIIFTGGTGNPFFTTDTASALRAVEMQADVLLKGTRVDGVYTADPEKDPNAVKFERLTFEEALDKKLKIMDLTSFTMCKENKMPVIVFDMNKEGELSRVIRGENVGTIIESKIIK